MIAALLLAWIAQEVANTHKPPVAMPTTVQYEVIAISWAAPSQFPPPKSSVVPFPALTEWQLVITYLDSLGTRQVDSHAGPVRHPQGDGDNPNTAEPFVRQLTTANFSAASQQRWALQHLMDEGKIPTAVIEGKPFAPQPPASIKK